MSSSIYGYLLNLHVRPFYGSNIIDHAHSVMYHYTPATNIRVSFKLYEAYEEQFLCSL